VSRVALNLEDLPVFDVGKNTAILVTEIASGFLDLDPRCMDVYSLCHVPLLSLLGDTRDGYAAPTRHAQKRAASFCPFANSDVRLSIAET
jgi:hypothetical protein